MSKCKLMEKPQKPQKSNNSFIPFNIYVELNNDYKFKFPLANTSRLRMPDGSTRACVCA